MYNYFLYLIFLLLILSSLGVILSRVPILSVLYLILTYLLTIFIFILLGADYLALATLIINVGAISVILSFVIMYIHSRYVELESSFNII